jgi:hypothetical protein
MAWDKQAVKTVVFAIEFIIVLAVAGILIPNFIKIIPAGDTANAVTNVSNNFNKALNTLTSPIFLIAFALVLVILAAFALQTLRKTTEKGY